MLRGTIGDLFLYEEKKKEKDKRERGGRKKGGYGWKGRKVEKEDQ